MDNLALSASYSHTIAIDRETGDFLLRRPKNKFSAHINFQFLDRGRAVLSLVHLGTRDDQEWIDWTSIRVRMAPFSLLSAVLSWNIRSDWELYLRLDNILNQQYELIKGYGTPGFSAYGGFKIQL
jgi:vitamin B12 transporter